MALENNKPPLMNDTMYTILKYNTQVVLPAIATLIFAMTDVWNIPKGLQIVGTITAIDTFLGITLGITQRSYDNSNAKYDGDVVVEQKPGGGRIVTLELNEDPVGVDIEAKKDLTFKVKKT